jgi:hypothetical protein
MNDGHKKALPRTGERLINFGNIFFIADSFFNLAGLN